MNCISVILAIIVFGVWIGVHVFNTVRADAIKAGYMVVEGKLYKIVEIKNEQAKI